MAASWFLYLSIFLVAASSGYIAEYGDRPFFRSAARWVCFSVLFIPAVLRYGIGRDYFEYINVFKYQSVEPGFNFIISACKYFGLSHYWFFFFAAALTYYPLCFLLPRKHYFFTITFYVLLFCYLSSYNLVRQLTATSFIICGMCAYSSGAYSKGGNKIRCAFYLACACLFHLSSVITLAVVIFSEIKIKNAVRMVVLISAMIMISVIDLGFIFDIAGLIDARYLVYEKNLYYNNKTELGTGLGVIVNLILPAIVLLNSESISKTKKGNFILNMNCFYIAAYGLALQINILTRIRESLIYIPLLSIGPLLQANRKYAKLLYYFLLFVYIVFYIKNISVSTIGSISSAILPYRSIFNQ